MVCCLDFAGGGVAEGNASRKAGREAGGSEPESGAGEEPEGVAREGRFEGEGGGAEGEEDAENVGAVKRGSIKSESSVLGADGGCDGGGCVEGRRRGGRARASDADFDDLLASYLGGSSPTDGIGKEGGGGGGRDQGGFTFGKAGGSLLVPLGALRLLRWVFR